MPKKDPRFERYGVTGFNKPKRTSDHPKKSHVVLAKEGDVLLFSSIQYENKKITISKYHIESSSIIIKLVPIVNILDEVYLHGLTGSLDVDFKKTPIDTVPKSNFTYKISSLSLMSFTPS